MDEMECPYGKINSMRFVPVSDNISGQDCIRGKWLLYIEGNRLICRTKDEKLTSEFEKRFETEIKTRIPKKAQWICNLRKEALQCK